MGTYYVHAHTLTVESLLLAVGVAVRPPPSSLPTDLRDMEEEPEPQEKAHRSPSGGVLLAGCFGPHWWRWDSSCPHPSRLGGMGILLLLPFIALLKAYQAWRTLRYGNDRPPSSPASGNRPVSTGGTGPPCFGGCLGRFDWYLVRSADDRQRETT